MSKSLRSGYTTGACAAAAAKAATLALLSQARPENIEIPFPDGSRVKFDVRFVECRVDNQKQPTAAASVIKDAGDDPDVTNKAEIRAEVTMKELGNSHYHYALSCSVTIKGGEGVGVVTKPGLALPVGEPAINPVPRRMIDEAVREALSEKSPFNRDVIVTISVPKGKELAQKTLNARLGIIDGISILGTTGVVRPLSTAAWTATITASMNVALATGLSEIVICTGRTSEKALQKMLPDLPDEAYVMMGDYLEFSLKEAANQGFKKIYLGAMWAKMIKAALETRQTHVRHGALEVDQIISLFADLGAEIKLIDSLKGSNTGREIFERLTKLNRSDLIHAVCLKAKAYAGKIIGNLPIEVCLVHHTGKVIERV